jgi:hypothetical protein
MDGQRMQRIGGCMSVGRLLVRGQRKGKAIRINVTLDEGLVAAIDKVAQNRSGFLADAARREGTEV